MRRTARSKPRVGVGIDIERVDRFRGGTRSSNHLVSRIFTKQEIAYCMSKSNPPMHFAGTFAAKEAAFKAVRAFHRRRVSLTDFEVSHGRDGAPRVKYSGLVGGLRAISIDASVSHTTESAVAVALAFLNM
jgi:holo-[acyl-carrier protein] synthase